ncbi:MAG: hypothetical protein WAO83_22155 [Fuerstiella sp.]|jgi:hypothetical protein
MFKKLALLLVIAAATGSQASAHGLFGPSNYFSYNYGYNYQAPVYAHAYAAPVYVAPAPVVYYRVPVYIVPTAYAAPVRPACGSVPTVSSVSYRSTPHRSVLRVRSW